MSASIVLRDNPLYKEVMPNCVDSDVSDDIDVFDIDVLVHCPCGTPFYIYVPNVSYQCDTCKRIFRATVTLRLYMGAESAT